MHCYRPTPLPCAAASQIAAFYSSWATKTFRSIAKPVQQESWLPPKHSATSELHDRIALA